MSGLLDGSVSTLAPLFAAAFVTGDYRITLIVGVAAATGAGISMGFSEALSDTGKVTGRSPPLTRGLANGGGAFIGGILHALPFLIPDLQLALLLAFAVVGVELLGISYIRYHYFEVRKADSGRVVLFTGPLQRIHRAAHRLRSVEGFHLDVSRCGRWIDEDGGLALDDLLVVEVEDVGRHFVLVAAE